MEESDFHKRLRSTGRNDPCPCGSSKKYKKCHLNEDKRMEHEEFMKRDEVKAAADKEVAEREKENPHANDSVGKKKGNVNNSFQQYALKTRDRKGTKSSSLPRRPAN